MVQPDGRILVMGEADGVTTVRRHIANGHLDAAFGIGGRIRIKGANDARLLRMADGRLVAVWSTVTAPLELRARRYTPDGILDRTFGANGLARMRLVSTIDMVTFGGAAFGANGGIYVAGMAWEFGNGRRSRYHHRCPCVEPGWA